MSTAPRRARRPEPVPASAPRGGARRPGRFRALALALGLATALPALALLAPVPAQAFKLPSFKRKPRPAAVLEERFDNGARLRVEYAGDGTEARVLYRQRRGLRNLRAPWKELMAGQIKTVSVSREHELKPVEGVTQNVWTFPREEIYLSYEGVTRFVDEMGRVYELVGVNGWATFHKRYFLYRGNAYLLISFQGHGAGGDATFVAREGGKGAVRLGRAFLSEHALGQISIDERNLLHVPGIATAFDMEQYAPSAGLPIASTAKMDKKEAEKAGVVLDDENRPVDALKWALQTFENLGEGDFPEDEVDEDALRQLNKQVVKEERGSAVIWGAPGVGKTALARIFAQKVKRGEIPGVPKDTIVLKLDPNLLSSGTKWSGMAAQRAAMVVAASKAANIIWFVDELHTVKGHGTHSNQENDVLQHWKNALSDGTLRILGATTEDEFNEAFGADPALIQRFGVVELKEPGRDRLGRILRSWARKHRKGALSDEALARVIDLSSELNAIDAQPRKAVSLLEEIYADLKVDGRPQDEPTVADVERAAVSLYRIDAALFDPALRRERLRQLDQRLEDEIVGAAEAKEKIVGLTRQKLAGTLDPRRPASALLFGPEGVGKTHFAREYAAGAGFHFKRIEMNSFGAYDGQKLRSAVAAEVRKNPFTVFLFDEFEKAPVEIQNELLAMADEGVFTVREQTSRSSDARRSIQVSVRKCVFLYTANAGRQFVINDGRSIGLRDTRAEQTEADKQTQTAQALVTDGISRQLLDRVDEVIPMQPPTEPEFREILRLKATAVLDDLARRHGFEYQAANLEAFLAEMSARHYRRVGSGRDLDRIVGREIRSVVSDEILDGEGPIAGKRLELAWKSGESGRKGAFCRMALARPEAAAAPAAPGPAPAADGGAADRSANPSKD